MLLLNTIYGFIMALLCSLAIMVWQWPDFNEAVFFVIWGIWSVGHTIYDIVAHQLVKFFNRNNVVTRDTYR